MDTALLYILGIVLVAVGLVVSIALHEIGHLIPAKLFKVRVGQYMIGFGRTLWSFRRGETEYGIKMIPAGGYISMAGMYPPARPGAAPRTASTGFFETLAQDARTASAEAIPVTDGRRLFYTLPFWKRIIIMLGGPFMNFLIALGLFAIILCGTGVAVPSTTLDSVQQCVSTSASGKCAADAPQSPAAAAGLRAGDRIVAVNGTKTDDWGRVTEVIQKSPGERVELTVLRDGATVPVTVTPTAVKAEETSADGKTVTRTVGQVGVLSRVLLQRQPASAILPNFGANIGRDFGIIINLPQRLVGVAQAAFGTGPRDPNGPVGLIGVGRAAGATSSDAAVPLDQRFVNLLSIVASLNLALLVFNLVPLMPLDGGHVAAALWEAIRRGFAKLFKRRDPGPVDIAKALPLTFTVVIILGAMSVLLAYADIVKPIAG